MAYNVGNLNTISSGKNKNSCTCWTYKSSLEDLATLTADGYFDEDRSKFSMGDSMYLKASDGVSHYYIESLSPHKVPSLLLGPVLQQFLNQVVLYI